MICLNLFLLLYADDIVIMSETEEGLKHGLFLLANYCDRWKLTVNATQIKLMIFRKGGKFNRDIRFIYKEDVPEIVSKITNLGIVLQQVVLLIQFLKCVCACVCFK